MKKFYLIVFLSLIVIASNAQMERSVWAIGGDLDNTNGTTPGNILDFRTSPPSVQAGVAGTQFGENTASICDPVTGDLLFYTNSEGIYGPNHQLLPNGELKGDWSTTQSVIVPRPCQEGQYYVFYMDRKDLPVEMDPSTLMYAIVDTRVGNGTVTQKDIEVSGMNSRITEKILAVRSSNGQDFWIITHEYLRATIMTRQIWTDKWFVFKVSPAGIGPIQTYRAGKPILSNRGSTSCGTITYGEVRGYLKASHDGKLLASAVWGNDRCFNFNTGQPDAKDVAQIDVLNFNNATGAITSRYQLTAPSMYGAEFSCDNNFLYVASSMSPFENPFTGTLKEIGVYQFDLSAGSQAAIQASRVNVFPFKAMPALDGGGGALQMGPNGKIYFTAATMEGQTGILNSISVINNPNAKGAACNFQFKAISLGTGIAGNGLPTFYTNTPSAPNLLADFTFDQACADNAVQFTNSSTAGSTASYIWSFGDGKSSTLKNPTHVFTNEGDYIVTLKVKSGCMEVEAKKCFRVDAACGTMTADFAATSACPGDPINFTNNSTGNYTTTTWNFGDGTTSTETNPTHSYNTSGTKTVTLTIGDGSNTVKSTGTVTVYSKPTVNLGGDKTVCSGPVELDAGNFPGGSFDWNTGDKTQRITVNAPGNYSVTVTNSDGCKGTASVNVNFNSDLTATVSSTTVTGCDREGAVIADATVSASGGTPGYTYQWNDPQNQTSAMATGLPQGTYQVTVTDAKNCKTTVDVTIKNLIEITKDEILGASCGNCSDGSAKVTVTGGKEPYTYRWIPSDQTTKDATGLADGKYTLTVTDENDCRNTIDVYVGSGVGIEDMNKENIFHVFPNPANGELNISLATKIYSDVEVEMFDLRGRTVYTGKLTDAGLKDSYILDITHLTEGVYFMYLRYEGNIVTRRIQVF